MSRGTRAAACRASPSLLLVDDLIFMVNDTDIASCLDARTGDRIWTTRVGGTFSASPVSAAGRIYVLDEDGTTTVIAAAREYRVLAENQLDEGFMASPTIAGRALYLRTRTHLYRIEDAAEIGNEVGTSRHRNVIQNA